MSLIGIGMSTSQAPGVIRDVFADAEQDLDVDEIIGKLFSAHIIDFGKYQMIQKTETTREKNRVLLEHLYKTADVAMLTKFCDILHDSTSPKHLKLEHCIRTKLDQSGRYIRCIHYLYHSHFMVYMC